MGNREITSNHLLSIKIQIESSVKTQMTIPVAAYRKNLKTGNRYIGLLFWREHNFRNVSPFSVYI